MFACVVIDQDTKALDKEFDYLVPSDMKVEVGMRVKVPFGARVLQGFVVALKESSSCPPSKMKSVIEPLDEFAIIKPEMISLMRFMCDKYHVRMTSVLKLIVPSEIREGKVKDLFEKWGFLADNINLEEFKRAKKQTAIIESFAIEKQQKIANLYEKFGKTAVKTLIDKNILIVFNEKINRTPYVSVEQDKVIRLNYMQQNAVDSIKGEKTFLLHGVTGSGKTEVYMHLISNVLEQSKTAIMLVPEISLTPQVLAHFKARFGEKVALLHSGLSAGEKFDEWKRLFSGEAKVAIGARSAIFAPLEDIGIVIIDEEHEQSYISESNPRYDTVSVAKERARVNACPLVLGSATPSIESYSKAKRGEYELIEMPVRANGREMPQIQIIDMMNEIRSGNSGMFSNQLICDLANAMNEKKQAMIFINRRGYSSFMMCKECGYVAKCTDCDVSLVLHRDENRLKCHYCGKQFKVLDRCPNCGSERIKQGAVGTQKVVEELQKLFPEVKVLRMDADTTSKKNGHQKVLDEFKKAKPGILVGTQMIAKGHDFEDVTLVGIVDADQSLYQTDYRSTERCFSLITQVSGRAGRSEYEGKIDLQTYSPRHYVYKYAANYDYKAFFKKEENIRETAEFPPFSRIIRILFSFNNENIVKNELKLCYNKLLKVKEKYADDFIYMDAMKSPLKRIQNKFRYQVIIRLKNDRADEIEKELFDCTVDATKSSVFFEINPSNMS